MQFLSYARNLFIPPSTYGIGQSYPIRTLQNAFDAALGGRDILALVNNGFEYGDIANVINQIAATARADGKDVQVLSQEDDLLSTCKSSLKGASPCVGAVVFFSSPTEGPGGVWNYTLRADGALGSKIDVTSKSNDQEIYVLPLQHAVDFMIASTNSTVDQNTLQRQMVYEYPYTSETQQQRKDEIRVRYMNGIIQILGVAFFIGICGSTYQLTGMMASERESQMSQLIECMMPNLHRWEPQFARLSSYHVAFSLIYLPGWVVMALILGFGVFQKTSLGILIIFHTFTGLSLSSFSLFIAAFFKKSQLSGIIAVIASLLLAVIAQVIDASGTGAVAILSLLFPPMNYTFFVILMARWEQQNTATNLVKSAPNSPWTLPGIALWIFLIIQIFAFPLLAATVERSLWGVGGQRTLAQGDVEAAVQLTGFTKHYKPNWFTRVVWAKLTKKIKDTVVAVNDLNLTVLPGQIMVLLGANGSGKSTTLDAVAGLSTITSGTITINGKGIGYCPQRNVLFKECTVEENVSIFNQLKSATVPASKAEVHQLIDACDLSRKLNSRANSLSGGQMSKPLLVNSELIS